MRRFISLIVISFLLLVNFNLVKSSFESSKKLEEINKEQEKVKVIEKENQGLKLELQRRESAFFIEQEARDRLDYGKNGETTIVLEDQELNSNKKNESKEEESNFQKWLNLVRN